MKLSMHNQAYLHDVAEDTDTTPEEIGSLFDTLTSQYTAILTDEPGSYRKERKSKTHAKWLMYKNEHLPFKQSVYRPNLREPLWKEIEGIVNT